LLDPSEHTDGSNLPTTASDLSVSTLEGGSPNNEKRSSKKIGGF